MISINDNDFKMSKSDNDFDYQESLTVRLDKVRTDFDQSIINEIVLWKINRYAGLDDDLIRKLNLIRNEDVKIDENLTRDVLRGLLSTKGIQLPMASTILRFKNPKLFQIIDQRVYRFIYGKKLAVGYSHGKKGAEGQIDLYFEYLAQLRSASEKLKIKFELSDRIFFMADKRLNSEEILDNYSRKHRE